MRFNPVYLVLGLLSMVYAAPVDLGSDSQHSSFETTLRARMDQNPPQHSNTLPMEVDKKVVSVKFTDPYAGRDLLQSHSQNPPKSVAAFVHVGLEKVFPEMRGDLDWLVTFGNEFVGKFSVSNLELTLWVHGVGDCLVKFIQVDSCWWLNFTHDNCEIFTSFESAGVGALAPKPKFFEHWKKNINIRILKENLENFLISRDDPGPK
ncbi:hypothetical protein EV368DRAFT_65808 [Lentinula lateritia]|uniref:Uncharacterized protein n=1 Tax=Lentinula aff. lateritia TaxID=2804960 RepID=A0ACC1U350_9AGAR|nr:hypothetical protein F5876DRAFT_64795 [Lentinula aff. lateritia]KAJ3851375.1 hypothetical protein EV368DRAFT_65808 [Lentinula lateritia]